MDEILPVVVRGELTVDIIPDGVDPTGPGVLRGSQQVLQGYDVPVEPAHLGHVDGVGNVVQYKTVDVVVPRTTYFKTRLSENLRLPI